MTDNTAPLSPPPPPATPNLPRLELRGIRRWIDGFVYDTDTAVLVLEVDLNPMFDPYQDYCPIEDYAGLFVTEGGHYFTAVYRDFEDFYERIQPLTAKEALYWAAKHCHADTLDTLFGKQPEASDDSKLVTVRLLIDPQVEVEATAAGLKLDEYIDRLMAMRVRPSLPAT